MSSNENSVDNTAIQHVFDERTVLACNESHRQSDVAAVVLFCVDSRVVSSTSLTS